MQLTNPVIVQCNVFLLAKNISISICINSLDRISTFLFLTWQTHNTLAVHDNTVRNMDS